MKYTIYLDFDGTVVEHDFPSIGRCNFGCIEVLSKLQQAGHNIILNTYRIEDTKHGNFQRALQLVSDNSWMLLKDRKDPDAYPLNVVEHTLAKIHPSVWDWEQMRELKTIFIDDITPGIPLKKSVMVNRNMVDFDVLDEQFKSEGLYEQK